MAKHYVLKIYDVEVHDSLGREEDIVTLEFQGELKPKTKTNIQKSFELMNFSFRFIKKVLA